VKTYTLKALIGPAIVLSMFIWWYVVLSSRSKYVHVCLPFVYICIAVGDPILQEGMVGITSPSLTPLNVYVCPKP